MASPVELRDMEESRPVYPQDDEPLSDNQDYGPIVEARAGSWLPKSVRTPLVAIVLICTLLGLVIATIAPSTSTGGQGGGHHAALPPPSNIKFFFVGFRHGNRNPGQFLKNDTSHEQWAWEGPSQLTNIGKRQAASLGAFLRRRYGSLVPAEFYPSQVKAWSSSAERCQQTLQSVMSGFFPPKGRSIWSTSLNWQPIPYEINDPLLRMYNVKCPQYTSAYQAISDDNCGACTEMLTKDRELVNYIATNSGFNASLSDLGDVADNILNMKLLNVPLPRWVSHPQLPGYPPKDMAAAILSFGEAHQILCANDTECSRIMAGLWLDHIIKALEQLKEGKLKGRLAHFYAAHTETVLSLIRLVKAQDILDTPTSAGFILEYTDVPKPSVRFIFHEPDPTNPDVRLAEIKKFPYCQDEQWCPLETFIQNAKAPAFNDWQVACKLTKYQI